MQLKSETPPELLSRLTLLGNLKGGGFGKYYSYLLQEKDEVLSVAAACALFDSNFVPPSIMPRVEQIAGFQAVRTRVFDYFMKHHEYDMAEAILEIPPRPLDDLAERAMRATFANDYGAQSRTEVEKFLQTGLLEHLVQAVDAAEYEGGWKNALPLRVKLVLINPQEGRWPMRLCSTLMDANEFELLKQFFNITETVEIFPMVTTIFKAAIAQKEGAAADGIKLLDQLNPKAVPRPVQQDLFRVRAGLLEELGKFPEAHRNFEKMNVLLRSESFDRDRYITGIKEKAALAIPELPPDPHHNYFMMLGFPRSGTTLLENILASHPAIETFEEIPSWTSLQEIVRPIAASKKGTLTLDQAVKARARYYREIERRKKNKNAQVIVDKLPILSAEAAFLKKLFPERKYIFSIRHPHDVVLSCFKQAFSPNPAMDNFTTFEDSCRAYDFVMGQWFKVFDLQSDHVCYVRYDKLVKNLKEEATRALNFLGVGWDAKVLSFAERAGERKVKTPSYANVRKGLSIGVQSSWRNYEFLFRKPEARVLDKWVKFFGYEGL